MAVKNETWKVAALIAELMKRSKQTRARISDVTLKRLAGRVKMETSIRSGIESDLLDYGYLMHRLEGKGPTSGHAIIAVSALHAAKPLKGVDHFSEDERNQIMAGTFDYGTLHDSLMGEASDEEE